MCQYLLVVFISVDNSRYVQNSITDDQLESAETVLIAIFLFYSVEEIIKK